MQNRWEGIEEFIAVVHAGSFSGAATQLGVSKAHVSQQISKLEERLGVRLLLRTTRKLSLTETGAHYLELCRPIIKNLEAAEHSVSTMQQEVSGRLRVSSPHLLGEVLLVPAMIEFQKQHPKLEIDLDLSSHRVNLLDQGYDVAIQLGARQDLNVVNKTLATTRFFVVASPDYLEKNGSPQNPEDLRNHQCLLFTSNHQSKPWKFQSPKGTVEVNINSHWRSNSGHLLRAAARHGIGLSYLPDYYLEEDLKNNTLIKVMPDWHSIDRKIVAIYQDKNYISHKLKLFLDFIEHYFQSCFKQVAGDYTKPVKGPD